MAKERKSVKKKVGKPKKATRTAEELAAEVSGKIAAKGGLDGSRPTPSGATGESSSRLSSRATGAEVVPGAAGGSGATGPVGSPGSSGPMNAAGASGLSDAASAAGAPIPGVPADGALNVPQVVSTKVSDLPEIEASAPGPGEPVFIDSLEEAAAADEAQSALDRLESIPGLNGEGQQVDGADGIDSSADSDDKPRKRKKKSRRLWLWISLGIIIVCIVGSCAVVSWERWLRYDDVADFQGSWIDARTNLPVTIDDEAIQLTASVSYQYELDTFGKTITYSFSQLSGGAMYLFSPDRSTLYIVEGESRDIIADTLRLVGLEDMPDYMENEQATILVRTNPTNTDPVPADG